ncbi:MAG: hypothetical protein M0P71_14695 [Melioribacteraceae bacterium]|jgi:hypothetical protein|nr:hypothetical protein [Melioribacteraceae bacterium]
MFLYLDEENNVKVTQEGMCLEEVLDLYKTDKRSESKPFFYKCMTYIYWTYKLDGEYKNNLLSQRKKLALKHSGGEIADFEENKKVRNVILRYIEDQTTHTSRLYNKILKDIDELITYLSDIPLKIKHKVECTVKVPAYATSSEMVDYKVSQYIEIDNSEEKFKCLKKCSDLIDFEETLKKKVMKEDQSKKGEDTRLFDNKESNE